MTTNLNDDFITRAFLKDVKAQAEKAKTEGVSAYLEEPKKRPTLRPNERFLRNTIASITHANKRVDEKEMRARRKAQLRGEGRSRASSPEASPSPGHGGRRSVSHAAATDQPLAGDDDEELEKMLSQRRVRGRGGCGPRVGSVGPYLSDDNQGDKDKARVKREVGPVKLGRVKKKVAEDSSSSGSSDSESEERRRKRKRKEKKRKKEKRKRRKKEEKKRKEKKK